MLKSKKKRELRQAKLFTMDNPKSIISEAFRTLRTNIQFSNVDGDNKLLVFTSAKQREGKSTVSSNLAYSIAESGKKTLIIDCDLRKPRVHKMFGMSNLSGLTNIIIGDSSIDLEVKRHRVMENLHILSSGPIPPNPAELLGSVRMKNFIEKVRQSYDMVIIDSPPIGLVTDSAILSTLADGTIMVLEAGQTEIDFGVYCIEQLRKVNAKILGVILNKVPTTGKKYYGYSYYQYENYYGE
ncbi:MAG: CpsD/CapB family tyrosine-protein kinase [Gudongella sp.]|jgi:capsular exopolysaccharide synthesis family protein|nr:CpsD/CapB family tyrosine-protein kinase [Gudongella sp.]